MVNVVIVKIELTDEEALDPACIHEELPVLLGLACWRPRQHMLGKRPNRLEERSQRNQRENIEREINDRRTQQAHGDQDNELNPEQRNQIDPGLGEGNCGSLFTAALRARRYDLEGSLAEVRDHHRQTPAEQVKREKTDHCKAGRPVLDVVEDLVGILGVSDVTMVIPVDLPAHIEPGAENRRQHGSHPLVGAGRGEEQIMHRLMLKDETGLAAGPYQDEGQRICPPCADLPGDDCGRQDNCVD